MRYYNLNIPSDKKEEVRELHLSKRGFEVIPPAVFEYPNLQVLDLSGNKIQQLPENMKHWHKLQKLDLSKNFLGKERISFSNLPLYLLDLNVSENQITKFPEEITHLRHLEVLNLSKNGLIKISASIQKLKALRHLHLEKNKLKSLLRAVGKLTELRTVNLSHNHFLKYPEALSSCQRLTQILFTDNRLNVIPTSIGNCTELSILNFRDNKLKHLPKALSKCFTLRSLDVNGNKFKEISPCIFQMDWLRKLNYGYNQLTNVDFSHAPKQLEVLNLEGNKINVIKGIPESVCEIYLDSNELTSIPKTILALEKLTSLGLSSNKIESLPADFGNLGKTLTFLNIKRNVVKAEAEDLLILGELKVLIGLLPNKKKCVELICFLRNCKHMNLSFDLMTTFFRLTKGDKSALAEIGTTDLVKVLNLNVLKSSRIVRKHLYQKRGIPYYRNKLKKGGRLAILGFTFFDKKDLIERLSQFGIEVSDSITPETTHILLGWKIISNRTEINKKATFLSEKTLASALGKMEKGYLLTIENEEMLTPIRQLLLHDDTANLDLAIELLKSGGCPHEILADIFLRWLKRREPKLIPLLAVHVEDDWKSEIFIDGPAKKLWDGPRFKKNIERFARRNKLNIISQGDEGFTKIIDMH